MVVCSDRILVGADEEAQITSACSRSSCRLFRNRFLDIPSD